MYSVNKQRLKWRYFTNMLVCVIKLFMILHLCVAFRYIMLFLCIAWLMFRQILTSAVATDGSYNNIWILQGEVAVNIRR